VYGEEIIFCIGLTIAAKAEQKSRYCTGTKSPTNQPMKDPYHLSSLSLHFTSVLSSVVDPDPDPHGSESFGNLYPLVDPHPHQIKKSIRISIRIRIRVIGRIRIRIKVMRSSLSA
jgi:hypothetical protein